MNVLSSTYLNRDSLQSELTRYELEQKIRKAMTEEPELTVFQTVKKNYTQAVKYRANQLANRSPKFEDAFPGDITKLVKNVKSQMKEHIFNPKDPISIIVFLAALKLACDAKNVHERETVYVFPHYVSETLANASNRRMYAGAR